MLIIFPITVTVYGSVISERGVGGPILGILPFPVYSLSSASFFIVSYVGLLHFSLVFFLRCLFMFSSLYDTVYWSCDTRIFLFQTNFHHLFLLLCCLSLDIFLPSLHSFHSKFPFCSSFFPTLVYHPLFAISSHSQVVNALYPFLLSYFSFIYFSLFLTLGTAIIL